MIKINLGGNLPIYKQIEEQVKQLIATNQLSAGEHMPTVRKLSKFLRVNPATVARAYQNLEQDGIVSTYRRRGTVVTGSSNDPRQSNEVRRSQLSNLVNSYIIEILSLGYSPEELEADFSLHLARWRIEREATKKTIATRGNANRENTIIIVGSHDLALGLLLSRLKYSSPEIAVELTNAGSLGGLLALQEGKADIAGIHLLDEETGEYNFPYVRHVLQDIPVAVVHLVYRVSGLMFARGNPKHVTGLEDLKRPDVTFVNRQKGAGTRVSLDFWLRKLDIAPHEIKGYEREVNTHMDVAMSIARGEADAGLGIEAAAHSCEVDFLPITKERFDLVIPMEVYHTRRIAPLLAIIKSEEFKKIVTEMGGYDTSQTGTTTFVE